MDKNKYYTTAEAALVLKKSVRATNYYLKYLFEDNTDCLEPLAFKIKEKNYYVCYYRKDIVDSLVGKKRTRKYKRTCKACGSKFTPVSTEQTCSRCGFEVIEEEAPYDVYALKALYLILTDPVWYAKATKVVIISWITAIIAVIVSGCKSLFNQ